MKKDMKNQMALYPSPPINKTRDTLLTEYQLHQHGRLVSVAMPATEITAEQFLHYAQGRARFFWCDGQTGVTFAGMGIAADLMAWGETRFQGIERQARELFANAVMVDVDDLLAGPRLFGGFAFREDFVPDFAWQNFRPAHFILPHYQLVQDGDTCWLTLNALLPADERPAENSVQLRNALEQCYRELTHLNPPALSASVQENDVTPPTISYPMPYEQWAEMIERAKAQFAAGALEKVVLARVCEARQSTLIDLERMLTYLQSHYAECYTFLFEPEPYHAFLGATPELLAATAGQSITTMGLAGSIQRGITAAEDLALANELLCSTKDRHEHALVVASIRQRLEPLTTTLTIPETPTIYPLQNIQHLYTPVHGQLREAKGILPLVEILHPTPALGGAPHDRAMAFIRETEHVPRGWYSGPVGWIDQTMDGAFGVAIRSAVAQQKRVWLYAGAGIVAASEAEKEWAETGWKFRPIQAALGMV